MLLGAGSILTTSIALTGVAVSIPRKPLLLVQEILLISADYPGRLSEVEGLRHGSFEPCLSFNCCGYILFNNYFVLYVA